MRAVVQRVSRAQVSVQGKVIAQITGGLLVFLGVTHADAVTDVNYLADKIIGLRIFEDAEGKMNKDILSMGGAVLVISQFTLYGDVRRGKRPSFDDAAPPAHARQLYDAFVDVIRKTGVPCQTGQFQERMEVELINDGPVTILLDSSKQF